MKTPITNQRTLPVWKGRAAWLVLIPAVAILLLGMTAGSGGQGPAPSARIRPIEDFLDAQGTLPVPAELHSAGWSDPKTMRFAVVDCTGLANKWIEEQSGGAISLGTETEGQVIERPLPDGRAEVTVLLHTKNALTWVMEPWAFDPYGDYLVFGHRAQDVLDGADPALGESLLKWVFINDAPGAPLPDLLAQILVEETVETIMISLEAHADGTLREEFGVPDGTPGRAQTTQIGPFHRPGVTFQAGWPEDHINLEVVGR